MAHGLLLKYILSHGSGIDVFVTFFGGFLNQGFILFGKRAKCNRRTCRFQRQRFYSKQSLFYKKTILEQGLLHHKRTQPVKGNATQNRKE